MSYLNKMLEKITSNYNKDTSGNIGKLFNIVSEQMEELKTTLETINAYRDIDNAVGATLDKTGANLIQPRGSFDDETYRIVLKTKNKRNTSRGDINTAIEVLASLLNVSVTDIYAEERYPASLYFKVPLPTLAGPIYSNPQLIGDYFRPTLAGGIGLEIQFEGAFEFGSDASAPEYSTTSGFSDITQVPGGYFGGLY